MRLDVHRVVRLPCLSRGHVRHAMGILVVVRDQGVAQDVGIIPVAILLGFHPLVKHVLDRSNCSLRDWCVSSGDHVGDVLVFVKFLGLLGIERALVVGINNLRLLTHILDPLLDSLQDLVRLLKLQRNHRHEFGKGVYHDQSLLVFFAVRFRHEEQIDLVLLVGLLSDVAVGASEIGLADEVTVEPLLHVREGDGFILLPCLGEGFLDGTVELVVSL